MAIVGNVMKKISEERPINQWSESAGVSSSSPWAAQAPYLQNVFAGADSLFNTPMTYFPGNTVAGFTPEQQAAMKGITSRAGAGSPLISAAKDMTEKTLRGDFLSPESNPWLAETYSRALEGAMPALRGSAGSAGRTGSYADMASRNDLMSRLAGDIYGGNYARERGIMASSYEPAMRLAENDYSDLAAMYGVGANRQNMNQALIDEAIAKHEFGQYEPWMRTANFKNLVSGNYGGTTDYSGAIEGYAPPPQKGGGK